MSLHPPSVFLLSASTRSQTLLQALTTRSRFPNARFVLFDFSLCEHLEGAVCIFFPLD
eukprot:m.57709 g.57709  ORF g.57709 m.57709 type:complete len:58 (-) comp49065_c0_seq1:854-1027(-)